MFFARAKTWILLLTFTGAVQFLLLLLTYYNKRIKSSPRRVVFINTVPIYQIKNDSTDRKLDSAGDIHSQRSLNDSKLFSRTASFRNTRPITRMQNDHMLDRKTSKFIEYLGTKSTMSTSLTTTTSAVKTSPYFEIRSEHFFRRILNPYNEQMLKHHVPYTYIIVPVMNSRNESAEYKTAQETLECYAALHKYAYTVLYADGSDENSRHICNQKDIMYRRHCVFAQFMKNNSNYRWFLFLDADIGVINPDHRLEDFTSDFPGADISDDMADLVFYNRIFNFETAAGSYLARNTEFAFNFLMEWSNYMTRFPGSFIGRDNGVLHLLLMDKYGTKEMFKKCLSFLELSLGYQEVTNFEACTRHFLLGLVETKVFRSVNGTVKVFGKGKSWVRDGGEILTSSRWSDNDFMFHGWKRSKLYQIGVGRDAWIYPFFNKKFRMDLCNRTIEDALSNWKYRAYLKMHNHDIESMLQRVINGVKVRYDVTVNKLSL